MVTLFNNNFLKNITNQNLKEYLESLGWKNVESPKATWLVYVGPKDYYGDPLEIVLSKKETTHTAYQYIANVVDLLATLKQETIEITVQRIQNVNRDVLNIRNIDDNINTSIPLELAAKQITQFKNLIKQASNSENNALPYYASNYHNRQANKMVKQFQFGHTQNRSFGFSIQSPILSESIKYKQLRFDQVEHIEPLPPIERRITERIVRGLITTKDAVRQHDIDFLINSYISGFSSNLCKAIIQISPDKRAIIEYQILWSPKIPPSNDIAEIKPILLNETDYAYLENASEKMEDLKPEDTFLVRGLVSSVTSTDDPAKLDSGRSVIVNWPKPGTGRNVKIIVELGWEDYKKAVDAHKMWYPIEITGEARLIGNRWRLLNPRDFRVVSN